MEDLDERKKQDTMSLPALHLKPVNTDGPWLKELDHPLKDVLDDNACKYMWSELQTEHALGGDHLAMSKPWWEMAPITGNGVLPFVVSTPGNMTEAQYLSSLKMGEPLAAAESDEDSDSDGDGAATDEPLPAIVRSNYKWLANIYIDPTDKTTPSKPLYAGKFGSPFFAPEEQRRCFRGEFQIVEPIKLIVDWHTRPLSNMGLKNATLKANGAMRFSIPLSVVDVVSGGPLAQPAVNLNSDTPPPEKQKKVPYMCIVGIDAICASKRVRMCGSMYYYDAIDEPQAHKRVVNALLQSCPYYNIGDEMSGVLGSRIYAEAQERFDAARKRAVG